MFGSSGNLGTGLKRLRKGQEETVRAGKPVRRETVWGKQEPGGACISLSRKPQSLEFPSSPLQPVVRTPHPWATWPGFPRPSPRSHPQGAPSSFHVHPFSAPIPSVLGHPPPSSPSHSLHPSPASLRSWAASLPLQPHPSPGRHSQTTACWPRRPASFPASLTTASSLGTSLGARSEPLHAPHCWPNPSSPGSTCQLLLQPPRGQESKTAREAAAALGGTTSTDVDLLHGNLQLRPSLLKVGLLEGTW